MTCIKKYARRAVPIALVCLLACIHASTLFAQQAQPPAQPQQAAQPQQPQKAQAGALGELQGTVTDQTGGVVVGAFVTLQTESGLEQNTLTDDKGKYVFQNVPPAAYKVIVRLDGFQDSVSTVELRSGERKKVDASLRIGISEMAEVKATDLRKNLSALVLTGKDIQSLPDDPQRFLQRILEMAGSTGRPNDVALLVDGFREYKRMPPKDTIEMIRINSNPFSAEFAQQGLDRIEITTKPGSDTYHGEIRFQGSDSALDSRNPLATTNPMTRTRNYNGYLQGPIVKQKLDFILYGGQWEQDENAIIRATVLDPAAAGTELLSETVRTPTRITSMMGGTNFKIRNQRVNLTYTRNEERRRNLGLESGLALPDYALDRTTTEEIARAWMPYVGRQFVNDVRIEVTRGRDNSNARGSGPALIVFDAFSTGGNWASAASSETTGVQLGNTLTVQRGKHTAKAGVLFESTDQQSVDRTGFDGRFIFGTDVERGADGSPLLNELGQTMPISPIENYRRTVAGLPGYAPSEYAIVRGRPDVGVRQWSAGWFVLDDWSLSNRMSLSYGLRQDVQSNASRRVMLQPRLAWSLLLDDEGKNAIKLGAGIFTGRVEPRITLETRKVNGIDRQQFNIQRPVGYPMAPPLDQVTPVQSAIYTKADDLRVPHSRIATIGYERQLPGGLFVLGRYTYNEGVDLLRLRNINAPRAGQPQAGGPVLQFESTGRSVQEQTMLGLRGNVSRALTMYVNYVYGKKESDTDDPFMTPADSYDLAPEYGPAFDDDRHTVMAGMTWELKGGLLVTPSFAYYSGRPFNITTGRDNNGDTLFSDRPAFATADSTDAIQTKYGLLDPSPQPGDRIIPRNFGRERSQWSMNLSLSQTIKNRIILGLDADNVLNTRRLIRSNGVLTSPTFGQPNQALNGRRLLLSARYSF